LEIVDRRVGRAGDLPEDAGAIPDRLVATGGLPVIGYLHGRVQKGHEGRGDGGGEGEHGCDDSVVSEGRRTRDRRKRGRRHPER
jgi:hypothetical protein